MPSSSKQQQKFMGMVHSLQKGEMKPSDASSDVKTAADSMSKTDAKDYASTAHKGLPKKVKQEILNKLKEYGGKMGRDYMGGDDIPTKKKGGLRDFDGYDNVDYNRDMPMDEVSSADSYKISRMLGTAQQSTKDFIDDNKVDVKKLESYIRNLSPAKKVIIKDIIHGSTDIRLSNIKKNLIKQIKESIKEGISVFDERYFGKKGIIIMIDDNGKIVSAIFKDKKNANKFNRNTPADIKKLLQLAKNTKYPKAIDESVQESGLPQNWMAGRTSDYHTKLRGKHREYDDTNFPNKRKHSGQPDLEDDGEVNEGFDKVEHLKLLNKALRVMPGSLKQKEIIRQLNIVRKAGGMRPLKETAIQEYGSKDTQSFLQPTPEDKVDGTPLDKMAIDADDIELEEEAKRDYKDEYKKFQSSTKSKKYRAELNKYNRDKNTYGNGDGKDASHKGGKIVGFETESKNRGRAEKSRLKKK